MAAVRTEDIVKALIEEGNRKGFLTYAEVNDHLPDCEAWQRVDSARASFVRPA